MQAPCDRHAVTNVRLVRFLVQAVQVGLCDSVRIENVTIEDPGWYGLNLSANATNAEVSRSSIDGAQSVGLYMASTGLRANLVNVSNTCMVEGYGVPAGMNGGADIGIDSGAFAQVTDCRVVYSGYHGISMGSNSVYRRNFVNHVVQRGNDGGGFYQWSNNPPYDGGNLTLEDNIVLNALGNVTAMPPNSVPWGRNIYTDDRIHDVTISGNTLARSNNLCLFIHGGYNITATGNTMFDCKDAAVGLQDEVDEPVRHTHLEANGMFTFGDATDDNGSPVPLQMTSANNLSNFDFGTELGNYFYSPYSNVLARRRIVDFRFPYRGPIRLYDATQWSHEWEHGDPAPIVAP